MAASLVLLIAGNASSVNAVPVVVSIAEAGGHIHDAKTAATISQIAKFCKTLKGGKKAATCEKLRKQFVLSIKKKPAQLDPCGPTKVGIKFKKAFAGNQEAKKLAVEMSQAKANIKPAKKSGEAGSQNKKEKKGAFALGEGTPLRCNLKV